jgi:hypothetical protein
LFVELVASMRQQLRRVQAAQMGNTADPLTRLRLGTAASLRYMAEHGNYFRFLDTELSDPRTSKMLRGDNEVYVTDAAKLISEGIALGLIVDENPKLLAYAVVSAVNQFSQAQRSGRLGCSLDETIRVATDWIERALRVPDHRSDSSPTPVVARVASPVA